ncbi:MAG: glycosyltransferase family 9 protein [Nitrospira sp.]|nr:glycosyltransferase family 9 protein [Nitrospira sp.]
MSPGSDPTCCARLKQDVDPETRVPNACQDRSDRRHVLILNITRMGDLVQMGPLLSRLAEEWPGCSVDLVVDRRFAPVAAMLPGLREVITYDFHELIDESRAAVKDVVSLYREMAAWIRPLAERRYDRIINLTFNKSSALLAASIGAPDIRGARSAWDGGTVINNPWMAYFADMHHFRQINRFNLVDVYALGGSGPGSFAPLRLTIGTEVQEWARHTLSTDDPERTAWIAVQAGASDVMKAWRPWYFGRTLALVSRQWCGGFLFLGAESERGVVAQVLQAYREAGGRNPVRNELGRTTVAQATALLAASRLLLTNDTGPMHLAVAMGVPVVDLSVGHVDFWETGPYGPGHWVLQPDLECAPCGFDQVCVHQACKDRVQSDQVAALLLHVLGQGPFPSDIRGFRVYQSDVDEDGLGTFRCRTGREPADVVWYASFWRRYWYETFTGVQSKVPSPEIPPPDADAARSVIEDLVPALDRACAVADEVVRVATERVVDVERLRALQRSLSCERERLVTSGMSTMATRPITTAFLRAIQSDDMEGLGAMARHHAQAYRRWRAQLVYMRQALGIRRQGKVQTLPMDRYASAAVQ